MLTAAVTIAGAAILTFRRHRTTVEPGQLPSTLVTGGVFAWSRNPIYVALIAIEAAIGIMADSLWILGAALLLWIVLDRVVVRREEEMIESVFGEAFRDYMRRVRKWL
jgi:protein-S-isoprenylcysteine O-methyltransferase Ste14